MNQRLTDVFMERIAGGLTRKTITTPSKWAEQYRVMGGSSFPGPWTFRHHPWLKDMHDSTARMNVGQKAAQMGFTELVLNLVLFKMDVEGNDCLYVLPSKTPDASDFSAARFDSALELSPHLERMFSDVKNVGHKRAGSANLYIRGSQSRSGLKSIPVSFIVLDEVEEMNQDNIALALERTSGQFDKQFWQISTPTIRDRGINESYNASTKEHFHFKCPGCSRLTELVYPDCLVVIGEGHEDPRVAESHLVCKECEKLLDHKIKHEWLESGIWVPEHGNRDDRGFHISQLYSSTVSPGDIAKMVFEAQLNPSKEQELHNSKLGLCHEVDGARVQDHQIDKARGNHRNLDKPPRGLITMGIDVGPKWNHFEIDQWIIPKGGGGGDIHLAAICKVIRYGKVESFEELAKLFLDYHVLSAVIDAQPERRASLQFANKFWGRVKTCFYTGSKGSKTITVSKDPKEPSITVDRTAWLDISLSRFKNETIRLPQDINREYRDQMKAPIRIYGEDKDGNPVGSYVKAESAEDHFAHSRNYAEIALPFAMSLGISQNVGKVL